MTVKSWTLASEIKNLLSEHQFKVFALFEGDVLTKEQAVTKWFAQDHTSNTNPLKTIDAFIRAGLLQEVNGLLSTTHRGEKLVQALKMF